MPGTDIVYGGICLRARSAVCGTERAYGASRAHCFNDTLNELPGGYNEAQDGVTAHQKNPKTCDPMHLKGIQLSPPPSSSSLLLLPPLLSFSFLLFSLLPPLLSFSSLLFSLLPPLLFSSLLSPPPFSSSGHSTAGSYPLRAICTTAAYHPMRLLRDARYWLVARIIRFAMCGIQRRCTPAIVAYAICLRPCYAIPGTEIAYAATRLEGCLLAAGAKH
eukprot:993708-Rhodomonas_salina.1